MVFSPHGRGGWGGVLREVPSQTTGEGLGGELMMMSQTPADANSGQLPMTDKPRTCAEEESVISLPRGSAGTHSHTVRANHMSLSSEPVLLLEDGAGGMGDPSPRHPWQRTNRPCLRWDNQDGAVEACVHAPGVRQSNKEWQLAKRGESACLLRCVWGG